MTKTKLLITAGLISAFLAFPASAGTWQQNDDTTWSYVNDDGSYATGWIKDNGIDYFIGSDGVMLADTTTPDGYYVDSSGAWNGQPAAVVQTVYQPGRYAVGVNIPAGEYVVFAVPGARLPYYEIRANDDYASYFDIIDNCLFRYNYIMEIEDGQFLDLDECTAVPISQAAELDLSQANMVKVGYHIAAGTYTLRSDTAGAYAEIYSRPNNTYSGGRLFQLVDGQTTVTVRNGEYLHLWDCTFAE